ncbi:hypothetical protein JCM15519_38480 [Fundidesulfovibrio butyratiphilus]
MAKRNKRDCATCGWGVHWERSGYDGKLHGRCMFRPSCRVPRHYGFAAGFGEETPMPEDCPAWKKPRDMYLVPEWKEEHLEYLARANDYKCRKISEVAQQIRDERARLLAEDPEMAKRLGIQQ